MAATIPCPDGGMLVLEVKGHNPGGLSVSEFDFAHPAHITDDGNFSLSEHSQQGSLLTLDENLNGYIDAQGTIHVWHYDRSLSSPSGQSEQDQNCPGAAPLR